MSDITWLDGFERQSWGTNGGTFTEPVTKIGLHSTETGGFPGYGGGKTSPHVTVDPRARQRRQHTPANMAARSFANPAGGVQTNRAGVIQVEIVGTCNTAYRDQYGYLYLPAMTDDELGYVAQALRDISAATGVPLVSTVTWKSYEAGAASGSYGRNNGVRLSGADFYAYRGVLGHQHVPENVHGDPGDINIARLLELAGGAAVTTSTAAAPVRHVPQPTDLTGTEAGSPTVKLIDLRNAHRSYVRAPGVAPLQRLLGVKADGVGGPDTRNALGAAQIRIGVNRDYIFGPDTASALLAGK